MRCLVSHTILYLLAGWVIQGVMFADLTAAPMASRIFTVLVWPHLLLAR